MPTSSWPCPPVAVVALGDAARHDDGIALRVLGRVRTLIAEIGCARVHAASIDPGGARRAPGRIDRPAPHVQLRSPSRPGSAARSIEPSSAARGDAAATEDAPRLSLFEWIEGGPDVGRLDTVLGDRRRVILIDAVRITGRPGQVHHWHLECGPDSRLSSIRHYNGRRMGLEHLALWLEDELPERGTDLIGIEPYDLSDGEGLSLQLRTQLASICSQVAGILVRILDEEGW